VLIFIEKYLGVLMATIEKINENSFNSGCKGKILLDELMLTPNNTKHMYISRHKILIFIHEKTGYNITCKNSRDDIVKKIKKGFKQK
jgi:tagatose-1,6-bisphosphate aldolase